MTPAQPHVWRDRVRWAMLDLSGPLPQSVRHDTARRLLTRGDERVNDNGRSKLLGLLAAGDPTVRSPHGLARKGNRPATVSPHRPRAGARLVSDPALTSKTLMAANPWNVKTFYSAAVTNLSMSVIASGPLAGYAKAMTSRSYN